MNSMKHKNKRVLAFDPNTKGFGYVVFEGIENIIDWGVKDAGKQSKNESSVSKIRKLLEYYLPDVLVVEDVTQKNRRQPRVKQLIKRSLKEAKKNNIESILISNASIKAHFKKHNARNKYQIAQVIARHYKVLKRILPPKRKIWMSEDLRMSIFKAVALVWVFYAQKHEFDTTD